MHKRLMLVLLISICVPLMLYAGTTGKISGRVIDKETGEPLPGVNVVIVGTTMGAATDINGYYFVINIRPGMYNVQAQMMGYGKVIQTEVQVVVDQTTKVGFQLSTTVLEGETVTIVSIRPLIQPDLTASATVTTSDQIETMPVETFTEVMVLTPGFVESGTGSSKQRQINVRGGRPGEIAYMIDGFYVEEPLGGSESSSDMGSTVANVGIAEITALTGSFSAEYGEALSGVLNIVTKEGGSQYEGRVRFRTDKKINPHEFDTIRKIQRDGKDWVTADGDRVEEVGTLPVVPGENKFSEDYWTRETVKVDDFDTYRTDFNLSGPIPFIGKKNTFFVSGEYVDTKTYLGWTDMPYQKDLRLNAKLILKPFNNFKLAIGGVFTDEEWKTYTHGYKYIPEMRYTNFRDDYMLNFTLTHTLNPSTFYTLKGARFTTNYDYRIGSWSEADYFSYRDADGKWQMQNPDGTYTGKAQFTTPDAEYEFNEGWWQYTEDDQGVRTDSAWVTGGGGAWEERDNLINTLKLDVTSQVTRVHQFKLGFEFKKLELMRLNLSGPYNALPSKEFYNHKPTEFSAYINDKMEFENWGMVVNAGLRIDYLDASAKYFADPNDPTQSQLDDAETKLYLSPRLGIAHPITDRAVLHFAYGHFYQVPDYQYLYQFENEDFGPYPDMRVDGVYSQIGNANLKPEKNIQYELGLEVIIGSDYALDVTAHYKDTYDYLGYRRYQATPAAYHRFVNLDYNNSMGIEFTLRKRFSHNFGGQINYTFSKAEGNAPDISQHFNDWYSLSVYKTYPPKKMVTMDWDQLHTINFVLDYRKANNWSVSLVGNFGSGLPYTPLSSRGIRLDEPMSARMPWTMNMNLRGTKVFHFMGLEYTLFADVRNLLNKINVLSVWGNSGKPDATIDWDDTEDRNTRPHYFSPPRTLELGLAIGF